MTTYQRLDYYIRNFNNLKSIDELAHFYYPLDKEIPAKYANDSFFNSPNYSHLIRRFNEKNKYKELLLSNFSSNQDYSIIKELTIKHGIFAYKFISHEFRKHIREKKNESFGLFQVIESEYLNYYQIGQDTIRPSDYDKIVFDFCQYRFYQLLDNKLHETTLSWIKKNNIYKSCACCGKKFNILALPDWIYYGANGNIDCCFECPINLTPTEKEIETNLKSFIESCGYIVESNFDLINYNSTIRIPNENWITIYSGFLAFGGIKTLKAKFGSWFESLVKFELLPNNVMKAGRGIKCIALSGNVCNSLSEEFVDNWLFKNGFAYEKEPFYPVHNLYNPNGKKRADWKVGDVYIEYFGLKGDLNYDKRTNEKVLLSNEYKLKLVSIFPDDLSSLDDKLGWMKKL